MTAQTWFASATLWMVVISCSVWFGQDVVSPQGRFWRIVAWFRDLVQAGKIEYKSQMRDRGVNHGGKKQEIQVIMPITFRSNRPIDAVRVSSSVYAYDGVATGKKIGEYSWNAYEHLFPAKGETLPLYVADTPYEPQHPGFYGDLNEGGAWLYPSTAHDIKIEVCSGRRIQCIKLAVVIPWPSVTANKGGINPGGRLQVYQNPSWLFPDG